MPTKARFLADFTLGFADGLTVPFALTAGLSSLGRTDTVVYAGVAEICAGSISMGISGYLSARGDGAAAAEGRTDDDEGPPEEDAEKGVPSLLTAGVVDYLRPLELPPALFDVVVDHVRGRPHVTETLADISEREEGDSCSPVVVGLSVSLGYMLGGILPLFPYFVVERVGDGLFWSFGICLVALFAFGFIKDFVLSYQRRENDVRQRTFGKKQGVQWADVRRSSWEGLQMVLLGGVAALAAVLCVRAFEGLREASGDGTA
ncbi:Ccc1 family [Coniochaeta sp. 2T2.1]|nr:Ccc1 family [Coniochaeta sp. 2T2.1]